MSYTYEVSVKIDGGWEFVKGTTLLNEFPFEDKTTYLVEGADGITDIEVVNPDVVAILSSPITFGDGLFKSQEVDFPQTLAGLPHYVGHPATRALLEALGAEYAPGRWVGPKVGESYLAVPLAQNAREGGWTVDTAIEDIGQLRAILITRIA